MSSFQIWVVLSILLVTSFTTLDTAHVCELSKLHLRHSVSQQKKKIMRLHLYSWAVFLSNKHYTLCTLALYLSLITRTVFTQFCGKNCFWESGDFIFIVKEKKERNILCLPLMKIIIGMFFFSHFFLSHVHHRKYSTAKLNLVIVNCSFRLGTVTGVYHLMLCKCFRAMSQTGLFTALMQAEVLLHVGLLQPKPHRKFVQKKKKMALFSVSCICLVCILQIKLFNYLWMYRRSRNGCRLSPSSITIITQ